MTANSDGIDNNKRILLVAPGWVGDTIMATAVFSAIRKHYVDASITIVCKPSLATLLQGEPWFDEILEDRSRHSLREFWSSCKTLKAKRFDLAILFPNSFRSAALLWFAAIPERVGYARNARGWMLTKPVTVTGGGSAVNPMFMGEYYARLVESIGVSEPRGAMSLHPSAEQVKICESLLASKGIGPNDFVAALNPGAAYGKAKCWVDSYFAEVGDWLVSHRDARVIVLAGPGEEEKAAAIQTKMLQQAVVLSPADVPLDVLKAVLQRTQILITNDTGPRHYAVALGTPVITVYGPTQQAWSDAGTSWERNIQIDVDCGPCMRRHCPEGHHKCMIKLRPETVIKAIEDLIPCADASASVDSSLHSESV